MQIRVYMEDEKHGIQNLWCLLPGVLSNKTSGKRETQGPFVFLCDVSVESVTMKLFCSCCLFVNVSKFLINYHLNVASDETIVKFISP